MPSYNDQRYQFTVSFYVTLGRLQIYLWKQSPVYVADVKMFVKRSTSCTP